jgi:hypothetical protein
MNPAAFAAGSCTVTVPRACGIWPDDDSRFTHCDG